MIIRDKAFDEISAERDASEGEIKIYGNQHGTFVKMSGAKAQIFEFICRVRGITPEELLDEIVRDYFGTSRRSGLLRDLKEEIK